MRDGSGNKLVSFLHVAATDKNITGQDVTIGITSVKETISSIVKLNSELRRIGVSKMQHQTVDLMARKRVKILLRPQGAPEEHQSHHSRHKTRNGTVPSL
jgi:hypothetical protein